MAILMTVFVVTPIRGMAAEKGEPLVIGEKITFHSKILDEDRQLWVYLPDGYEKSSTNYPVLYLLDGDQHFFYVAGLERETTINNAREFEKLLKDKAPAGLDRHFEFLEKDEHGTISHRSFCSGLERLYTGFLFPEADPSVQSLEGIKKHYNRFSEKFGFPVPASRMIVNIVAYDLLLKGKPDEAIKLFKFNIKNHPDFANGYNLLGRAYEEGKQFELAKKNYQTACKLAEKSKSPLLKYFKRNLERLLKKQGSDNQARETR
jgi:tetratricopeptide (TPR) repeat protein